MGHNGFKLHPLFVPVPIALLLGALAADLTFWRTGDPLCATAASWLLLGALIACGISLTAGIVDSDWGHVFANAAAVLILVIDVLMREGTQAAATIPAGPVLGAFAVTILLVSGGSATERAAMQKASWRAALTQGARTLHLHHAEH